MAVFNINKGDLETFMPGTKSWNIIPMEYFQDLENYISKIPGIKLGGIGKGQSEEGLWWIKSQINITHPLAWRVERAGVIA